MRLGFSLSSVLVSSTVFANMLPKHRSGKQKKALQAELARKAEHAMDEVTTALRAPRPAANERGSMLPHQPPEARPAAEQAKAARMDRLIKGAKQNGGMVAQFGSALLSISVSMLAVGLFLALPLTAAAEPCFTDNGASTSWTGHENPDVAEDFIVAPYLQ
jgi:hypothetical protein